MQSLMSFQVPLIVRPVLAVFTSPFDLTVCLDMLREVALEEKCLPTFCAITHESFYLAMADVMGIPITFEGKFLRTMVTLVAELSVDKHVSGKCTRRIQELFAYFALKRGMRIFKVAIE